MNFICSLCDNGFKDTKEFLKHKRIVHQQVANLKHQGQIIEVRKLNGKFKCPLSVCGYESESAANLGYHWRHVCSKKYIIESNQSLVLTMNSSHVLGEQGDEEEEIIDELQAISEVDTNRTFVHEDSSQFSENEILERYGLRVNAMYNLLICIECKTAVIPIENSIKNHLRIYHKLSGILDDFSSIIGFIVPALVSPHLVDRLPTVTCPIAGIEVHKGFSCTDCQLFTKHHNVINKHMFEMHQIQNIHPEEYKCYYQSITRHPLYKKYFRFGEEQFNQTLHIIPNESIRSNGYSVLEMCQSSHLTHKTISSFFTSLEWHEIVEELPNIELPPESEFWTAVINDIFDVGTQLVLCCDRAKQRIFDDEDFDDYGGGNFFRTLREPNSEKEYRKFSAKLLCSTVTILSLKQDTELLTEFEGLNRKADFVLRNNDNPELKRHYVYEIIDKLFFTFFSSFYRKGNCPLYLSLIYSCLRSGSEKSFLPESICSRNIAKTKYFVRLCCVYIMGLKRNFNFTNTADILELEQKYFEFFKTPKNSAMSQIIDTSKIASHHLPYSAKPPVYWKPNSNGQVVLAECVQVSLSSLKSGASTVIHGMEELLRKMLSGFQFKKPQHIYDDLNQKNPGYCFVTDTRNNFRSIQARFSSYLESRNVRISRFFSEWNEFIRLAIFAVHLTCGYPSRGTELETAQWINTIHSPRNIFIYDDFIAIVYTYNKVNNIIGYDRAIPRFLPKQLGDVLICYLVLLHPILSTEYVQVHNIDFDLRGFNRLFFVANKAYGDECLRRNFMVQFRKFCGKTVKFHIYRHVVECFGSYHLPSIYSDSFYDKFSEQAGHSSNVGHFLYGSKNGKFKNVSPKNLQIMFEMSKAWHSLLLSGDKVKSISLSNALGSSIVNQSLVTSSNQITIPQPQPIVQNTEILRISNLPRIQVLDDNEQEIEENIETIESDSEIQLRIYYTMKFVFKMSNFTCKEQALAMSTIFKRNTDLIVVMPTGFGKNLTFLVPLMLEQSMVTVLIVPLVSIKMNVIAVCHAFGIRAAVWNEEMNDDVPRLIIATPETAAKDLFRVHMSQLSIDKRLSRIVIDECHLIVNWSGFRNKFGNLKYLSTLSVPIICLTATLPLAYLNHLKIAFGTYFDVVRNDDIMRNISFEVRRFSSTNLLIGNLESSLLGTGSTLIFVPTIAILERVHESLRRKFDKIAKYHGKLDEQSRFIVEEGLRSKNIDFVVSTIAFGIGVDISNIENVFIIGYYDSMIDYVQMAGRIRNKDLIRKVPIMLTNEFRNFRDENEVTGIEKNVKKIKENDRKFVDAFLNSLSCRKELVIKYLCGKSISCPIINADNLCDNCEETSRRLMMEIDPNGKLNQAAIDNNEKDTLSSEFQLDYDIVENMDELFDDSNIFNDAKEPEKIITTVPIAIRETVDKLSIMNMFHSPLQTTPKNVRTDDKIFKIKEPAGRIFSDFCSSPFTPKRLHMSDNYSSPVLQRSLVAEQRNHRIQLAVDNINDYLSNMRSICGICSYRTSSLQYHSGGECSYFGSSNVCKKCQRPGHSVASCELHDLFLNGNCSFCGLPGNIDKIRIHEHGTMGKACKLNGEGKIVEILCLIYNDPKTGHQTRYESLKEFVKSLLSNIPELSDILTELYGRVKKFQIGKMNAQTVITKWKAINSKISEFQNQCIICKKLQKSNNMHTMSMCPEIHRIVKSKCLYCYFGDHPVSKCPVKMIIQDEFKLCFGCCMKESVFGIANHSRPNKFGMACDSIGKNLFPFILCLASYNAKDKLGAESWIRAKLRNYELLDIIEGFFKGM